MRLRSVTEGTSGDRVAVSSCSLKTSLSLLKWLIHMSFHQQRMAAISKHKLLAVVVKDAHIRDAALNIGHIVHGILGIFAVAIDLVLVLQ